VTVNAVARGFVATDMTAATAERIGITLEEFKTQSAAQIPVGRVGEPEDVADAVSFFASPRAGYASGQVLDVAGGPVD
jgi:3-oxoacyl-[acyl-carrier protein] reductase